MSLHSQQTNDQRPTNGTLKRFIGCAVLLSFLAHTFGIARAAERSANDPPAPPASEKQKVIIDTDIGSDIDDAFAVALALSSPEIEILGFTTGFGDTIARAKIIDRMLTESGRTRIPVAVGRSTTTVPSGFGRQALIGLQKRYGESAPSAKASHTSAVDFILEQIRRFPGQVTLVTIGPLSNIGDLIDKDAATFGKLNRVVMMGGWVAPLSTERGQWFEPAPEHNIAGDIGAAKKLFRSGVPLYVMPLDSTIHLALDEVKRSAMFSRGVPLTNSLGLLYLLWGGTTPVLFDSMAVAFVVNPQLCPVESLHIDIDDNGISRVNAGPPNAHVCLHSDPEIFFDYHIGRVAPPTQADEAAR